MSDFSEISEALMMVDIAFSDGGFREAEDVGQFLSGVIDGMRMGLFIAEDPNLVPAEVYDNIEAADFTNRDYLRGALAGVIVVPRLIKRIKTLGAETKP